MCYQILIYGDHLQALLFHFELPRHRVFMVSKFQEWFTVATFGTGLVKVN